MKTPASDASHWYGWDGQPSHFQFTRDGRQRSTTLADAKKKNLLPSVTNIIDIMNKPALTRWKIMKTLEVADEIKRAPYENVQSWIGRVMEKGISESVLAASLGSKVHSSIENWFEHGTEPDEEVIPYVLDVLEWHETWDHDLNFVLGREQILVSMDHGYGGKTDFIGITLDEEQKQWRCFCGDYKTRKTNPSYKVPVYEADAMQLAAYLGCVLGDEYMHHGIGYSVIISSTEPGRVEVIPYEGDDLFRAWEAFLGAYDLWRYSKKYDPVEMRDELQSTVDDDAQPDPAP